MLDFMRRQSTKLKWVWVLLIFIFSVTLVTLYIPVGDLGSVSLSNDVASIGAERVSAKEFQAAYRNYLDRMRSQLSPEMLKAFRFDRQILDALITRHVMMEEAKRLGLSVSAAEIEQKILENPVFREGGNFIGLTRYQTILQQNNLTVDEFESGVRDEILLEKLRSFVGAGVTVGDKEVEEEYRRKNEKAKIDYFVIDPAKLEAKATVSDQEQKDYYEKNKAKYNVAEKRQASYIYLDTVKQRSFVTVSNDDLKQYYDQHQSEYNLPERVTAQHILFKTQGKSAEEIEAIKNKARGVLDRAKKGEDFSGLAKQFSEDESSKINGGDLGSFTRGQMVPEFDNVAFSLGPGAISDLVQTQFGIHIIKVVSKQEARARPLQELEGAIRSIVSTRKAEQHAAEVAQTIAVELVNNKDLKAVADKHGAEVRQTPMVEQTGQIPDLGNAAELTKRMFSMNKNEIGNAIQVERGYVIPQLTEIQAAHPASFEEAKDKVLPDVKSEKARQMATDQTKQVEELLKSGKDLSAAAKAVGGEVKTSDLVERGAFLPDFGSLTDVDKEIFSLPIGKTGTPNTIGGKTLAFSVKERHEINTDEMKKSMDSLRTEMLPAKREQYFSAYIQEARKRMEDAKQITINENVLEQASNRIG
jgi:Parvulin-like peptidyl-prolyl isomerase